MKVRLLAVLAALSLPAVTLANGFACDNDKHQRPQWSAQVYNGEDNKVSTFIFASGKKDVPEHTIARITDARRITQGGKGVAGTTYQIKLNEEEKAKLLKLADKRLKHLKEVTHAVLQVYWDSGDEDINAGDVLDGTLLLNDKDGQLVYGYSQDCRYKKRSQD